MKIDLHRAFSGDSEPRGDVAVAAPAEPYDKLALARGQRRKRRDIASRLGVTEGTVKVYLHSIFDKVESGSRTELAIRASGLMGRNRSLIAAD